MKIEQVRQVFSTPADNPLVPKLPITFRDVEIMTILYTSDKEHIEEIVPEPLEVKSNYVMVHIYHMNDADWFGNYYESAVQVDVALKGTSHRGSYSPYLYLNHDGAIATGREVYGQPKRYGNPSMQVVDGLLVGRVERNGIDIITTTLPYKKQRAEPKELTQHLSFVTNINLKVIPSVDGSDAIRQLTARTLENVNIRECWKGPATIELRPNEQAPVYRLPVRNVLGGFYWITDFTVPFGNVIFDYLKQ